MREMKDSGIQWIGEIPKEWEVVKIKNVADIIMGQSPNGNDISNKGNILFMQGNADFGLNYPAPKLYCDKCSKKSRIGDILMSVRAPVGEMNISDKIYGIGRGLCSIKPKIIERQYLWYYLLKSKSDFNYYSNGSTFDSITLSVIFNFPIAIPPLSTQQKISSYLDTKCTKIDSIIEKQEKVIEKLKEYKLSVITEAVTKGLNPDVKMKDSGVEWIGEIPESWDIVKLGNIFSYLGGYAYNSDLYTPESDYQVLRIGNVKNYHLILENNPVYINKETSIETSKYKLKAGTILFTMTGTKGKRDYFFTHLLTDSDLSHKHLYLNQRVGCLIPIKDICPGYYNYLLKDCRILDSIFLYETGTANQGNLGIESIKRTILQHPSLQEQKQIADYLDKKCSAIDTAIEKKQAIIEKLKEYKKSLIYEVVTGKKEV